MLRLPCLRHTKLEFNAPSYFWKVQRFRYRKLGRFDSERPVHPNFAKCYSVDYRAMGRLQCPKGSKFCCVKQYARTFCPVDCINCIFQYFHDWRYIYFSLRKLCCCSCVFPWDKSRYVKANGLVDSVGRSSVKGREFSWTQRYESRMRRFNLEVVLVALMALALLIGWLFNTWEAFQKSVPLLRPGHLSTAVEKVPPRT